MSDEQEQQQTNELRYQCVFAPMTHCQEVIDPHQLDPCSVVLTVDWLHDRHDRDDNWQQWWCHFDCFVNATGRSLEDLGMRDFMKEVADERP